MLSGKIVLQHIVGLISHFPVVAKACPSFDAKSEYKNI